MSKADGGVVIEVHVEDDKAQKELNKLEKTIEKTEEKVSNLGQKKDTAQQAVLLSEAELKKETQRLDELKAKLAAVREADKNSAKISTLEEKLQSKEAERSPIVEQLREATTEAEKTYSEVERLKKALAESKDVRISPEAFLREQEKQEQILSELKEQERVLKEQEKYAMRLASQDEKQLSSIQKLTQELNAAKQQMATMPQNGDAAALQSELQRQQEAVRAIQAEHNRNTKAVAQYEAKIAEATQELTVQKEEAGALVNKLYEANSPASRIGRAIDEAGGFMELFTERVRKLAKRVFVFTVITSALRSLKTWLSNVVKGNGEAQTAMARLKGALLTLAQPLLEVIIPAFTTLVNILTAIVGKIAAVVSALFGKTAAQSAQAAKNLNSEQKALEGVGGAAEEAAGSLAGFDEINTIQTEDKTGGGAGGGGSSEMLPDFSGADMISDKLKKIADMVLLIGTGFAMWKIGTAITGTLGTILQKLGLTLMLVGSVILYAYSFNDAWNNGVDWGNLIGMITGLGIAALAVYKLFGPNGGLASGIVLIVGGLAMLVLAIKDVIDNGWNLQNTLLTIAAIMATGLGIATLVGPGGWIAVLIAGIVALIVAIVANWDKVKEFFIGLWDKIKEVFSTAWDFIAGIWKDVAAWFSENVIEPVKNFFAPIKEFLHQLFEGTWIIIQAVWKLAATWFDQHVITPLVNTFAPIVQTISAIFSALWASIQSVWQSVAGWFSARVLEPLKSAFSAAFSWIKNFATGIVNGIIGAVEAMVNWLIDGINFFLSAFNAVANLSAAFLGVRYGGVDLIGHVQLPRLAQGAVIPPNREFMAVLGDQKSGYNYEVPDEKLRKLIREETAGMKNSRPAEVKIYLDRKLLGSVLIDEINKRTIQAGRSVLKI